MESMHPQVFLLNLCPVSSSTWLSAGVRLVPSVKDKGTRHETYAKEIYLNFL